MEARTAYLYTVLRDYNSPTIDNDIQEYWITRGQIATWPGQRLLSLAQAAVRDLENGEEDIGPQVELFLAEAFPNTPSSIFTRAAASDILTDLVVHEHPHQVFETLLNLGFTASES
jgi:hypothetical protein